MGALDLLSPVFSIVDETMAFVLPATIRLMVWAAVLAVGTMLLYKVLSPQAKIGVAKRDAREARRKLNTFDGEFADAGPLIRNQFVTAFRHIGLVVPGTIIAILPLLCFLVWADNHFDYRLPANEQPPAISTEPANPSDAGIGWQAGHPPALTTTSKNGDHNIYKLTEPVTVITKASFWNWIVGNPLGYLPDDSPIDAVHIALPEREFIPVGPGWIRGWLGIFMPVMFIVSLLMFKWARIE
ncbi:MAG: hypothetical protein PF501_12000 [Salinisphaera sp.]|jgi:hypothetical protein|nr:hypothetical protein [Salinisphaera sp.]